MGQLPSHGLERALGIGNQETRSRTPRTRAAEIPIGATARWRATAVPADPCAMVEGQRRAPRRRRDASARDQDHHQRGRPRTFSTGSSRSRRERIALSVEPAPTRCTQTRGGTPRIMMTPAAENGKTPLRGPSVPQRCRATRRRVDGRPRTPPSRIRSDAVARSTARILFLQQPALGHQLLVELLVLLGPTSRTRRRWQRQA